MINAATSLPYKGRLRKSRRNGRDSKCGDHDDYTVAVGVRISIFEILICTKAFQSLQCRENYIYFGGHMQPVQYRACKIVLRFLPTIFRSFWALQCNGYADGRQVRPAYTDLESGFPCFFFPGCHASGLGFVRSMHSNKTSSLRGLTILPSPSIRWDRSVPGAIQIRAIDVIAEELQ